MVRLRHFFILPVLGILALWGVPALKAQQRLCFAETGQCIEGRFRTFWEQNGGLPVFGLPITAAVNQVNRDTGRSYLTQWFERNRFELHPENAAPYDVLLGRLGDDRLRQDGTNWQELPRAQPVADCLWFEATRHNICNTQGFRTYWQSHGLTDPGLDAYGRSLALFGLPLTEAFVATNSSGDTVVMQWFERTRFEYHPNNPAEYKVLLGLLGREVLANTRVAPTATVRPTATTAPTATPTDKPEPTERPRPTNTPRPTSTERPTATQPRPTSTDDPYP